jgi:hypothetical protein
MNETNFRDFEMILTEMESLFFCLIKRTNDQGLESYILGVMIYG